MSNYRIVQVMDAVGVGEALADALGIRVVVEQARRLLLWRRVRVHLDTVVGLGHFVELEAVSESPGGLDAEEAKILEPAPRSRSPTTCWWHAATRTCWSGSPGPAESANVPE